MTTFKLFTLHLEVEQVYNKPVYSYEFNRNYTVAASDHTSVDGIIYEWALEC